MTATSPAISAPVNARLMAKTVVELTLPNARQHHAKEPERSRARLPQAARRASAASQYQLYLPSKELLKHKLDDWSAAASR